MLRRTRRIARILVFSVAAVVILLFGLFVWGNMMLIGRPFPIRQVDSLKDPVAVTGWDTDGLVLANGQRLRLPLSKDLPVPAKALAAATQHGIEIHDSGAAFGLVEIHHWCGNDPVRYHLAKVNLANLLAYVTGIERAQRSNSALFTEGMDWPHAEAFIFGTHGWRIEWFHDFVSWEQSGVSWLWQSEPTDDTASWDIESRAREGFAFPFGKGALPARALCNRARYTGPVTG